MNAKCWRAVSTQFIVVLLTMVMVSGCRKPVDYARTPIRSAGVYRCFGGDLSVTISQAEPGRLNYQVSRKEVSAGPSQPGLLQQSPWIIYAETADRVWVYDGGKDVTRIDFQPNRATKFTSNQVVPEMMKEAPAEFRKELPEAIAGHR